MNAKRNKAAVAIVREFADSLIELAERQARGWDKGQWRDDLPAHERGKSNTIRQQRAFIARYTQHFATRACDTSASCEQAEAELFSARVRWRFELN